MSEESDTEEEEEEEEEAQAVVVEEAEVVNMKQAWNLFYQALAVKKRGDYAHKRDDYDKAIEFYKQAIDLYEESIKLYPRFHQAWNNLGYAYKGLKQYDKAIECYEKALAIKPDYHKALHSLSEVYWERGRYEDLLMGMSYLKRALRVKPSYRLAKKDFEKFEARRELFELIETENRKVVNMIESLDQKIKNLPATASADELSTDLRALKEAYITEFGRIRENAQKENDDLHAKTRYQRYKTEIITITGSILSFLLGLITIMITG